MNSKRDEFGRFIKKSIITLSDGTFYPKIPVICNCQDTTCNEICWNGEYKVGHSSKGENNPNYNKCASNITREKQRRSHLGQISSMKGKKRLIGSPMKGKHHKPESNEKNRQAHLGNKAKQSTKDLISKSLIGKMCGKDNPNWNGGKSFEDYPPEFDENLRESIRKRDNYTCQLCGREQELEIEEYKLRFAIHHINRNKFDCRPENLVSLCIRCHGKINFNPHHAENLLKLISRINSMSTLSNEDIKKCLESGILKIHGINEKTIRENGVDLTLSKTYAIENDLDKDEIIDMHNLKLDRFKIVESNGDFLLYPNQFMLLSTKEIVEIPNNIMGFCCIRSTIARNGILCPPTIADCGFKGALTIEIYNTTKKPILLHEGDRFLHVVFDYVNTPSSSPYCGLYQGQCVVTPPKKSIL